MELLITPEVHGRIERRLKNRRWQSPSQIVETALDLLDELDNLVVLSPEELDAKLEESLAQVKRGETHSLEEVKARLRVVLASSE